MLIRKILQHVVVPFISINGLGNAAIFGILFMAGGMRPSETFGETPAIIKDKGCDQCHEFSPEKGVIPLKAPSLYYAGEKFQAVWLETFLKKPVAIRLAGFSQATGFLKGDPPQPHTAVNEEEAKEIVGYLMKLKKNEEVPVIDSKPLSKGQRVRAKIKFERDYGCTACHQAINLAGKSRGGVSGPSLVNAGNRLNADWVYRWLINPRAYVLKSRMPLYRLSPEEAISISKYIMTLKIENLK